MKKTLIALAALGAMAGAAQAQSTVTLYGLLDADFGSFKTNVGVGSSVQSLKQVKIDGGGLNGNRWGLRVKEDIGGGMAVIGNIESGFDISTGASSQGALFGRKAIVGLAGGFGTVTLGRNTSSYDDVAADHAMMGATIFDPSNTNTNNGNSTTTASAALLGLTVPSAAGATALASFLGRNTTWIGYNSRFNNSVKYASPSFGGFSGGLMYGLGEDKTTTSSASKTVSANLKYANGPLLISGGYQSEAVSRTATAKPALENTLLNFAYNFGVAKVGLGFNRAKYKDVINPSTGTEIDPQKEVSLSVAVPLGATTLSAGVARSKGDDLGKSTGFGVQALYSLSKRTTLYAGALSTKAYSDLADETKLVYPTSNIGRTTTYAAGIRHTF
ncbi:porin [Polaromonas sp. JS666]|uniref:porin n=1 Tax=Polaromonas sp. (strain JS666 / ATCC BAA-500) TaxID=296591 RepID=UPI000053527A|nr:porin [Polaromonas sp. JS666]ABE42703.1 porin, Gram-negative type [Polaromonas sp. JS666]